MFIQNLFIYICDTLFPPSTEALRVRTISTAQVDLLYNETTTSDIITLSAFSHPDIQALIHEAKFHSSVRAQKLLGHLCDMYMEKHSHTFDCIAPIPLSPARYRARGYNQVHEILRYSTHARQILVPNILKRVRDTRAQTSLGRAERLQNMQGAFSVTKPSLITNKHILIVDEVTTTGATLRAAKASLLPHSPASITLLALAH